MVKRRREDPNGDENGGKWVRGTSTVSKVFNNTSSSKLKLTCNDNDQADGPDTHPNLYAESMGVLMTSSHRFDYTKYWEQQGEDHKLWLWYTLKIREKGAPPSQGDFFVLSYTSRMTNDALDEQSRGYIEKMKELAGRDENRNQQPLSDKIYRQVMPRERHGRVRLMGRGVTPTSYFFSQAYSHGTIFDRVAELENEMAEMRRVAQEKEEEMQHELDEIKRGFDA